MTKKELVEEVAKDAKISQAAALLAVDSMTRNIMKGLKKGDHVSLVGFGRFSVKERAARKGRNPQTGKEIQIQARKVVRFTPGQPLKDAVN
ncbi:bacterial nucleoid DNA-binding protein (plasmid) [Desulfocapsa sulfexigens DSM 10523]|uniref:Bacterial nucleoid DNA-binding protein n=1 Tax=Desulfocapsa sulfexigens (strain DSM 10523 / SB164P1) TaxID=1167006 RepID=M1PKS6_DESSD|nr:HU family DNA-binding protein [Desulfocapsa sulfexigens]AGF80110.1 bacterial nucleoid DNA-binding protein [Desulfocapsa sulfexigens DSM 10523]